LPLRVRDINGDAGVGAYFFALSSVAPDFIRNYPRKGTSLIVTAPVGLLPNRLSIFIPENRPGLNPSLGTEMGKKISTHPCCAIIGTEVAPDRGQYFGELRNAEYSGI
jgi:hypothetical protein